MSLRNTVRALPTLLRIGFLEAVAYRAEMFVWVLSTTMPLVMLALWSAVARDAPIAGYGRGQFTAYFLSTFVVRQLTGCWVFWEMNFEVKNGTLAMRLLRPVEPIWSYAAEGLAAMPMRILVSMPVAGIALAVTGARHLSHDPFVWLVWVAAIFGAWALTLLINVIVGCAAFFLESSLKVMDLWLVLFFVFSGYLIPIDLFPARMRALANVLPFRYQIGFPVELMTGAHPLAGALHLLARQWMWNAFALVVAVLMWRSGLKRFAAYGG
ncbi:MAG TPA: ABC-2 family transporter protein [Polyangiaceae bacterium]|nr:ABC-2 family transporter protein [Polyangiaceae bacterium]